VAERSAAELLQVAIELGADPGNFASRDAAGDTERLDQIVDLARGHAVHVALRDHGEQRPVDPPLPLEQRREGRPLAQLGDRQLNVARLGGEQPGSVLVALSRARLGALVGCGADERGRLRLDELLEDSLQARADLVGHLAGLERSEKFGQVRIGAATFATSRGAKLAHVDPLGPSLSPSSLLALTSGEAVVLPSPNGSTCAALAAEAGALVLAGCLRNAAAIGSLLHDDARPVTVIACGERWPDGSLGPAVEDFLGAGAVLASLGGRASPEARAAMAAWHDAEAALEPVLLESASGQELCEWGLIDDVRYAAERDVSDSVPMLIDGAFRNAHR
jgi:2-phosphosulfolactate phosphatase